MFMVKRVIWVFNGVLALLLALNIWSGLRGGYGWRWPYTTPDMIREWLPALVGVVVYVVITLIIMRHCIRWQVLGWAMIGSILLPYLFLFRWGDDPLYLQFTRAISVMTSGPHWVAAHKDVPDLLPDWTLAQRNFEDASLIHVSTAPPGLPLLYEANNTLLEHLPGVSDSLSGYFRPMQCQNMDTMGYSNAEISSAWIAVISPVWAALAILPLFWLARQLMDQRAASWSVLLWPLIPGITVFTPSPNTIFPALIVLMIALLWKALISNRAIYAILAGIVMFVATFVNFSILPALLLAGLLTVFYYLFLAHHYPWWWTLKIGASYSIGLGAIWIMLILFGLPDPVRMFRTAIDLHVGMAVDDRPYLPWIGLALWDYALFLGMPLMSLAIVKAFQCIRQRTPLDVMALGISATLLLLALSGITRGENARIWLFLMPFSLLAGVGVLNHHKVLLITQATAMLVIGLFLSVMGSGLAEPPQTPPQIRDARIQFPSNFLFDGRLRLTGFDGVVNNHELVLDLRWQADEASEQPYYISILPVAPNGTPYGTGVVYQPFESLDKQYPTTCWQVGQEVIDRIIIPLEGDPPSGDWWISLSVYDFHTFQSVRMVDATQNPGQQAGIGPIQH